MQQPDRAPVRQGRPRFPHYLFRRYQSLEQIKDSTRMQQPQQQQQQPMTPTLPTQQQQQPQSTVRPRHQLASTGACPEELLGQPGPLARAPSMRKRYSYANKACHSTDEVLLDDAHQGCQESSEIVLGSDGPSGETTVRGGTLRGLVEFAISCFEVSNKEVHIVNQNFLEIFFLMHEWISDSVTVVSTVIELCNRNSQMLRRGLLMIRFWINKHPSAFEANKSLATLVEAFFERVNARDLDDIVSTMNIRDITRHEWLRLDSMKKDRVSSSSVSSLVFNQLEAEQLAEQLTVLEFKAFRRIRMPDLKAYTSGESLRGSPTLERCVLLFNGLSQWVQCMVLSKSTPAERARVVAKFLEVAEELLKLKNFNTLMAVIGGLSHSTIARLSKTHACLSQRSQKLLVDFSEFLSSSSNFASYRKEYAEARDFKIPILAVHLKDLIQLNVAVPDKLSGGGRFINWRKVAQLGQTMSLLHSAQRTPLPVEENVALCNTLRLSLDCHYTEDDIYEVSLLREPRSLVSPSTPTKPVVFAQWVSGSKPPHPETLKRHIFDMVEAVFKVYDHDKDEMISETEFAQIAENFPFIDSFAVLDADNDGMISKNELKNYFIRANSHALKNSFKHDFHETSYFKPTFCDRCNGLLWGLIKQGWKCRDCSINVHKHCKDTVVMECRVRAQSHRGVAAIAETPTAANAAGSNTTISTAATSNGGLVCGANSATAGCAKASRSSGSSGCCSPVATADGWAQTDEDGRCIDEAQKLAQENETLRGEADTLRQQVQSQTQVIARLRSQEAGLLASSASETADQTVWCLVDSQGGRYWLSQDGTFLIGRSDCQLQIKSATVEPRHALVTFDPSLQRHRLKDLGSAEGTFVNNRRIGNESAGNDATSGAVLEADDSLRFGREPAGLRVARFAASTQRLELPDPPAWAAKAASTRPVERGRWQRSRLPQSSECPGCAAGALLTSARTHSGRACSRSVDQKKIKELYGQPDWWGMDDADVDEAPPSSRSTRKQPQQQQQQQQPYKQGSRPIVAPHQTTSPPPFPRQPEAFLVPLTTLDDSNDAGSSGSGPGSVLDVGNSLSSFVPQRLQRVFQERDHQRRVARSTPRPAAAPAAVGPMRNSMGRAPQQQPTKLYQPPGLPQSRLQQLRRGSAPSLVPQASPQQQSRPSTMAKESKQSSCRSVPTKFLIDRLLASGPAVEQRRGTDTRQSPVAPSKHQRQDLREAPREEDEGQTEVLEAKQEAEAKQDAVSEAGTYTISEVGSSDGLDDEHITGDDPAQPEQEDQELEMKSAAAVASAAATSIDSVDGASSADQTSDTSGLLRDTADALHQLESHFLRTSEPRLTRLSSLRHAPVLSGVAAMGSPRRHQQQQQQQLQRFEYGRHSLKLRSSLPGGFDLRRDLDRLGRREDLARRSAFTEVAESPSPTAAAPGPQTEAHLLASSLHQLSQKLRRCTDDIMAKLRRGGADGAAGLSPSPSPTTPAKGGPGGSGGGSSLASGSPRQLQEELLGCLRHLQAVQLQVQALDRALFPGQASVVSRSSAAAVSCSDIDYLAERERISSELGGFQPIEPAFPATEDNYTDYRYP